MFANDTTSLHEFACRVALYTMCNAFDKGLDVVLDDCNLTPMEFQFFNAAAIIRKVKVERIVVKARLEEILERNEREKKYADEYLKFMFEQYAKFLK